MSYLAKFMCKVITPMFMAGEDKSSVELRPSEFKGMMRYWWRAIRAEESIEKLKKEEAGIFGGTGEGEGRSKVRIILNSPIPPENQIEEGIGEELGRFEGCKYLLSKVKREYIKEGHRFEIRIKVSEENKAFKHALCSLWCSIYLGGFGARARRGWGNVVVEYTDSENVLPEIRFVPTANNKEELSEWINKNIKEIRKIIGSSTTQECKYTTLSGGRVVICEAHDGWKEALDFIGRELKEFRKNKDPVELSVFGMPLIKGSKRIVPYIDQVSYPRLSSPLIIKVIESNSKFFPVVIRLNLTVKRVKIIKVEEVNDSILNKFIELLKRKKAVEIKL